MRAAPRPPRQRLLWRHLWLWALLTLLGVWVVLAAVAYYTGLHEADEINDGQLLAFAQILLREDIHADPQEPPAPAAQPHATVYAPDLRAVAWEAGRVVWDTHGMAAELPAALPVGLQTVHPASGRTGPVWRAYVTEAPTADGTPRRVAVFIDMGWRRALGRDIAEHMVRPALVLLPLAALLLAWAIRRGLAPLAELSRAVGALDLDAGQAPLPAQQPFQEFSSTVHAINALAARLQSQLERERRFTADVAHELRTPLTSLLLQARLAGQQAGGPAQQQALHQLEQDAQRAARVLGQLLDLARAQKLDGVAPAPVDLHQLAQQVLAAHASMAHERGQELALQASGGALTVPGHATMLELALRNLVDNALRHTPPGTLVEVHAGRDADGSIYLAVQDDGTRAGAPRPPHPGSGLGVGLGLVQRIAQAQGAVLEDTPGGPHAPHRVGLRWPAGPGSAA